MVERTYIIAVDAWNANHDVSGVKDFIKSHPNISDWWNYIPYVFMVVTSWSADELSDALKEHTKDASLIVVESRLRNVQGLLPERACTWIDGRAQAATARPAASAHAQGERARAPMEAAEGH